MKKASFAYDLERQMRGTHDVMRIMEASTRISRQMDSIIRFDLPEMLGLNSLGEAAKSAIERARDVLESIARHPLDQLNSYQDFLKNSVYFRPLKDVIGDLATEKYTWLDDLKTNPLESILKEIEGIHHIKLKDIFRISSEMKEFYANLPDDEIVVQEDQSIACAGKTYDISEIKELIEETIQEAEFSDDDKISKKDIERLLSEIKKVKDTCLQKIIWSFICPLIILLISLAIAPHIQDISKNVFSVNKAKVTKFIEREIPKTLSDKNVLYDLRFVIADVLNVRIRDYQRSDLIGTLYFGSIVRVIQKKTNWTLIVWKDEDNDLVIQGWVFSRYLKKFKI
ncbi:MAG: SH3 domain-containing protein [Desulfobacteraceae bacterium]|nr:SH3 domain-containing protein [Desulfobacteraceae bacterium]